MTEQTFPYKRILLKLSGEALMGKEPYGISSEACLNITQGIKEIVALGIEVGIVIGGGNIFRGIRGEKMGIQRASADQMGMLATMINGIALAEALKKNGVDVAIMSAISCGPIVEEYGWQKAQEYLKQKKTLIFVGGTGSPYFTTDTAASLRAAEIGADALLKATKVDGIYSKDPIIYKDATRFESLKYEDALAQKLNVMDATSIALCMENRIPILVFNMQSLGTLTRVFHDKNLRTLVQ
jgi:uridylate kinase